MFEIIPHSGKLSYKFCQHNLKTNWTNGNPTIFQKQNKILILTYKVKYFCNYTSFWKMFIKILST